MVREEDPVSLRSREDASATPNSKTVTDMMDDQNPDYIDYGNNADFLEVPKENLYCKFCLDEV